MFYLQKARAILAMAWANVTLEPALFVIALASKLDDIPLTELLIYKVCINKFNFSEHMCENLLEDEFQEENQQVQYEFTKYNVILSALQSALPSFAALYFGAWCDMFGRKFIMALYWFSKLVGVIILQLNAYWKNGPPELYIVHVLPNAIIGGGGALWVGQSLFISDITPPENRAFRFAMLAFASSVANPIGTYAGAIVYRDYGIVVCLTLSLVIQVLGVGFMFWKIRGYKYTPTERVKKNCGTIFDPNIVKDSVKTAFKKRPGRARFIIFFLLASCFFLYAPSTGERVIGYIFLRDRFKWGPIEIATMATVLQTWGVIVQAIVNPMIKFIKMNEIKMLIGFVSLQVLSDIFVFLAHEPWLMYLARMVDITTRYAYFIVGSLFTCCAPVEELGRVNAVFGIADNFNALFVGPLYRELYQLTLESMLGAPYLLSAASGLVYVLMMSYILCIFNGKTMSEITGYNGHVSETDESTPEDGRGATNETEQGKESYYDTYTRVTLSLQDSVRSRSYERSRIIIQM